MGEEMDFGFKDIKIVFSEGDEMRYNDLLVWLGAFSRHRLCGQYETSTDCTIDNARCNPLECPLKDEDLEDQENWEKVRDIIHDLQLIPFHFADRPSLTSEAILKAIKESGVEIAPSEGVGGTSSGKKGSSTSGKKDNIVM